MSRKPEVIPFRTFCCLSLTQNQTRLLLLLPLLLLQSAVHEIIDTRGTQAEHLSNGHKLNILLKELAHTGTTPRQNTFQPGARLLLLMPEFPDLDFPVWTRGYRTTHDKNSLKLD